jgi:hypothetical protein
MKPEGQEEAVTNKHSIAFKQQKWDFLCSVQFGIVDGSLSLSLQGS